MKIDMSAKLNVKELYFYDNHLCPMTNCTLYFADDYIVLEASDDIKPEMLPALFNKQFVRKLWGVTMAE